jgi:hypothetical protein
MTYDFTELNKIMGNWATDDLYRIQNPQPNNIILQSGNAEMLRVAEDGFYVRGKKVPVDDKEAATVYAAFKEFLVWNRLSRE